MGAGWRQLRTAIRYDLGWRDRRAAEDAQWPYIVGQLSGFCANGRKLASASGDYTVHIWDGETVELLKTLRIGTSLKKISFKAHDSCLIAEIGPIILSHPVLFGNSASLDMG